MHTIDIDRAVIADLANNNKDIRSMNMDIQKSQPQDTPKNGFVLKTNFYCDVYDILWLNHVCQASSAQNAQVGD